MGRTVESSTSGSQGRWCPPLLECDWIAARSLDSPSEESDLTGPSEFSSECRGAPVRDGGSSDAWTLIFSPPRTMAQRLGTPAAEPESPGCSPRRWKLRIEPRRC